MTLPSEMRSRHGRPCRDFHANCSGLIRNVPDSFVMAVISRSVAEYAPAGIVRPDPEKADQHAPFGMERPLDMLY
jgi:hypothetical protein